MQSFMVTHILCPTQGERPEKLVRHFNYPIQKVINCVRLIIMSFESCLESLTENLRCLVCLDLAQDPSVLPCCGQIVCTECIKRWIDNHDTCPYCRREISQDIKPMKWACDFRKIVGMLKEMPSVSGFCDQHGRRDNVFSDMLCETHQNWFPILMDLGKIWSSIRVINSCLMIKRCLNCIPEEIETIYLSAPFGSNESELH